MNGPSSLFNARLNNMADITDGNCDPSSISADILANWVNHQMNLTTQSSDDVLHDLGFRYTNNIKKILQQGNATAKSRPSLSGLASKIVDKEAISLEQLIEAYSNIKIPAIKISAQTFKELMIDALKHTDLELELTNFMGTPVQTVKAARSSSPSCPSPHTIHLLCEAFNCNLYHLAAFDSEYHTLLRELDMKPELRELDMAPETLRDDLSRKFYTHRCYGFSFHPVVRPLDYLC